MPRKTLTLSNRRGLHARAATRLVACCQPFESKVHLYKGTQQADACNIMALLILAAPCGTELTVHAEGEDADEALKAVEALFNARFDEDQ